MCEIRYLDSLRVSGVIQTRGHLMKLARSFCRTGQPVWKWCYYCLEQPAYPIACSPSLACFKKNWNNV